MTQCPHCSSSEQQTKSGHTRTGSQRYRCKQCQRIYTPDPKPLGYPEETRREAVRLYLEGTNFRRIGRILSVNHQSVVNWVNAYHAGLPAAERALAAGDAGDGRVVHLRQLKKSPACVVTLAATADRALWTNTGTSAVTVDIRVHRYSTTRTTYQLSVSY